MGFLGFIPIVLAIIIAIAMLLLFTVVTMSIGIGGASASLFVKNKIVKRIMIILFLIVFLVGLMGFCPFIISSAGLPSSFTSWGMGLISIGISLLAIFGVKFSKDIQNKIILSFLNVLFYFLLFTGIALTALISFISLIILK